MVDKLVWEESYALGIRSLDQDHQRLFKAVNALIDEVCQGSRGATVQEMLDLLLEDSVAHFDREERAMARVAYPWFQEHCADHYLLLRTVVRFKSELKYDRLDSDSVARFLVDWVQFHLIEHDLKFKPYLTGTDPA